MTTASVLLIFSNPSTQWTPLTGSTAKSGFCTPDMVLLDGGGVVTISSKASGTPYTYKGVSGYTAYPAANVTLVVAKGQSPTLVFNVVDSTGKTNTYFLGGVALQNMASGGGAGGLSFPLTSVGVAADGTTTLSLQNNDQAKSGTTSTYDFWVLVQNSSGDLGLIDPLVTNSN